MTAMNDHTPLTRGQKTLGAVILLLALAVTPVFFIEMFLTVNGMLGPHWNGWAWTVPVASELTFTLLFLWAVLMEWLRRGKTALWIAPYPFAIMSAFLNVWAAHGNVADMMGHLVVTLAFFAPVTFAKAGVRGMLVTDEERTRAVARKDAQAHARDMLRSALGIAWKFRASVLLRRQLRSGRLPAKVLEAAEGGNATEWEPAVEAWIAAAVALPERTRAVLDAARAEALAHPAASPSETPSGGTSETPSEVLAGGSARPSGTPSQSTPAGPSRGTRTPPKPRPIVPRKCTDEQLADLIVPLLADGEVTPNRVVTVIREKAGGKASIGFDRAKIVLALAEQQAARVVPIGERKTS